MTEDKGFVPYGRDTARLTHNRERSGRKPGVENMLETCAGAFSRKRPGHARRPPGRRVAGLYSQARFSRLGATLVAHDQTNILKTIRKPFAHR